MNNNTKPPSRALNKYKIIFIIKLIKFYLKVCANLKAKSLKLKIEYTNREWKVVQLIKRMETLEYYWKEESTSRVDCLYKDYIVNIVQSFMLNLPFE